MLGAASPNRSASFTAPISSALAGSATQDLPLRSAQRYVCRSMVLAGVVHPQRNSDDQISSG